MNISRFVDKSFEELILTSRHERWYEKDRILITFPKIFYPCLVHTSAALALNVFGCIAFIYASEFYLKFYIIGYTALIVNASCHNIPYVEFNFIWIVFFSLVLDSTVKKSTLYDDINPESIKNYIDSVNM